MQPARSRVALHSYHCRARALCSLGAFQRSWKSIGGVTPKRGAFSARGLHSADSRIYRGGCRREAGLVLGATAAALTRARRTRRGVATQLSARVCRRGKDVEESDVDPAFGVPLRPIGELVWPAHVDEQQVVVATFNEEYVSPKQPHAGVHTWDATRPCVIRGFAREWDFVKHGRFDPGTDQLWRQALAHEHCPTEFQPSPSHLKYEEVDGMQPSLRLVNPALLVLSFEDFADACHMKSFPGNETDERVARAAASPERRALAANVVYEGPGWESDPRCLQMRPHNLDIDFAASAESFSLYCAQHDVSQWPEDVLRTIAPFDPASLLTPSWSGKPPTVNAWMCGGGPHGGPVTCNFHCDYSENFHVVLSGHKEFFLCHPADIDVLRGTSYCAQAVWNVTESRCCLPAKAELAEMVRSELRTPMCVASIDMSFEDNSRRCSSFRHAASQWWYGQGGGSDSPLAAIAGVHVAENGAIQVDDDWNSSTSSWHPSGPMSAELHAGDLIYIPAGWLHAVRTWRPDVAEKGLPFSMGINFWHECTEELWEKEKMFRLLDGASMRHALVGDREHRMAEWLAKINSSD